MQKHEEQGSSGEEITSTGDIKRYRVIDDWHDHEVYLEVDHSILTPERAQEINEFWGGDDDRLDSENGDHVRAVIRLAGSRFVQMALSEGGTSFSTAKTCAEASQIWSRQFRAEEGWGGEDDTPYGWCGIRIITASVEVPGFDDFELEEVANA